MSAAKFRQNFALGAFRHKKKAEYCFEIAGSKERGWLGANQYVLWGSMLAMSGHCQGASAALAFTRTLFLGVVLPHLPREILNRCSRSLPNDNKFSDNKIGNENSAQSFSDRSFWKSLRVVDVRTFGSWIAAPKFLFFFQDFECPDRSFGPGYPREWPRTSAGYPARKLPFWADFPFLITFAKFPSFIVTEFPRKKQRFGTIFRKCPPPQPPPKRKFY